LRRAPGGRGSRPHSIRLPAAGGRGTPARWLGAVRGREPYLPFLLMSLLIGGPAQMHAYSDGAVTQTDDRMALEFSGPRAIYGRSDEDNAVEIRALAANGPSLAAARAEWSRATDEGWTAAGGMEMKADAYAAAYERYRRALAANPSNPEALAGLSDSAAGARRPADARQWLEAHARSDPANANVRIELSRLLAATGDL